MKQDASSRPKEKATAYGRPLTRRIKIVIVGMIVTPAEHIDEIGHIDVTVLRWQHIVHHLNTFFINMACEKSFKMANGMSKKFEKFKSIIIYI